VARLIQHQEVEIADGSCLTVSLQTQKLTRGCEGQVKFTVENTSAVDIELVTATSQGNFSDELTFLLTDSDENVLTVQAFKQVLGQHIITLPNGKTVARIPAGEAFDADWIDLAVPASAPNQVKLQFKIDQIHYHLGQDDGLSLAGITRFQNVSLVDTAYYGELTTITPATSYGKEPIVITGKAIERSTNQAMPLVPLQLVITLKGFERDYQVYTDENGTFSYQFNPLENES
ncbi:MAG: hypothetical protein VSS75_010520, partial [Candidatus Parabeggiatoa sp.]|nr:hypothetical protein [Candidatus Parabeggiatoa sp.]